MSHDADTNMSKREDHRITRKPDALLLYGALGTGEGLKWLTAWLIDANLQGEIGYRDFASINSAVANMIRLAEAPEALRKGEVAISSDYVEIMEIVRRLRSLPLETQELVVKALFGERVKSEASHASDPNTASCSEHNGQASCHA